MLVDGYLFSSNLWYIKANIPFSLGSYFLFTVSALAFKKKIKKMINLIIDAANEKIVFAIVAGAKSYTTSHINSRENFDKFMKLISNFLNKKKIKLSEIDRIYVNLGPGKFTSLRISLSIAKAISFANKTVLIGFETKDLINKNYKNLTKIRKKKITIKSLIKPIY